MAVLGSLSPFGSLGSLFGGLGLQGIAPPAPEARTLRQAVYRRLSTDASITALVGDRIFPVGLPQGTTLPAVTHIQAGSYEPRHLRGRTTYRQAAYRVSAWAHYEEEAEALADAIRERLTDWRGWQGQVFIGRSALTNEIDQPERPTGGTDQWVYQIILMFSISHK